MKGLVASSPTTRRSIVLGGCALVVLQIVLFYLSRPSSVIPWGPLDLVGATLIGAAVIRYRLPLARGYPWLAGGSLTVVVLYGVALRVFPVFFGRPFAARHDVLLTGNLIDLVFDSGPLAVGVLLCLVAAVTLVSLTALIAWLIASLGRGLATLDRRVWLGIATTAVIVCGIGVSRTSGRTLLASELIDELAGAHSMLNGGETLDAAIEERRREIAKLPADLSRISADGQSVFLFSVESYGEAIWKEPSYRERFEPFRREAEKALRASGFHIASRRIRSPVKGGGSWFAHTTILTGFTCDNALTYGRILESRLSSMPVFFEGAGYRTVSVLPAVDIPKEDWPEGNFFGFDERFWFEDFGYSGPRLGWSPIPDQFAIQSFHERLVGQASGEPLFVDFTLTSSHSPFRWVPPYIEEDPSSEALASAYRTHHPKEYDNSYHRLSEPAEGYTESIRYSLRSVVDYALRTSERDAVFIVVGDHQPMTVLAGTDSNLVPLHVFSRDAAIVQRFLDEGFGEGLLPKRSRMRMQELLPLLLRMFSR